MYEDLKSDYINPMDFANKLNQVQAASPMTRRGGSPGVRTHTRASDRPVLRLLRLLAASASAVQYVLWEYIGHAGLTLAFLLSLSWTAFFLNVPLLAFHANKYARPFLAPRPGRVLTAG